MKYLFFEKKANLEAIRSSVINLFMQDNEVALSLSCLTNQIEMLKTFYVCYYQYFLKEIYLRIVYGTEKKTTTLE